MTRTGRAAASPSFPALPRWTLSLARPVTRPPEPAVEGVTGCLYCGGQAEPEQDGDLLFFACPSCGGEFGHRRAASESPLCAAGLPISVTEPEGTPVFLGTTIPMRSPE
jgi:hypothetical protein